MDARLSERIRHESIPAEFGYIEDKHRPEIEDRWNGHLAGFMHLLV